jgi:hypothetical protein
LTIIPKPWNRNIACKGEFVRRIRSLDEAYQVIKEMLAR